MSQKKKFVKKGRIYRTLVASALIANGIFQFVAPVLAQATSAGGEIKNSATATYEDPNNPNTPINTTSNEVVVQVAEVAGITVTTAGTTPIPAVDANNDGDTDDPGDTPPGDADGDGAADAGDRFYFNYTVTNVGNDPTKFRIPNLATTTGPASVSGNLEFSTDGGATWTPITTTEIETGSVPVNGTVQVRVPVEVTAGATAGTPITVKLGDTPGDDQNQQRDPNGGDVYTVDNPNNTGNAATDIAGEVNGDPVNGVREASATQQITVDEALKTYALAKILKERSDYSNSGTLTDITDDTLAYDLSVEVEQNDPTGNGINPAPLVGTPINLDGSTQTRILISDAIPAGTDFASFSAPPGWIPVYTDAAIAANANDAATQWSTTQPANLANVTRIGFVNDPAVVTSVNPGQPVTGFKINLSVEAGATAPLTVNNIAQLFGSTPDGDNDPTTNNPPVIDESGDNNPSNFNDNGTPPAGTDTTGPGGNPDGVPDAPPTVGTGVANPTTMEVDSGNNNSGTGPDGEVNQFIIDPTANELVNGPDGAADAIGPNDNNDDFTNKSSLVPPGQTPDKIDPATGSPDPTTIDPSPVPFTNTVSNGGGAPADISLIPTPPANPGDLPTGSTVTVSFGADSAVYTWDGTQFTSTDPVITVPAVAPGAEVNYGVEVNLPDGTPLSTDLADPTDPTQGFVGGFPVPITAFIDTNNNGTPDDSVQNITIDRVYTGYLRLDKETRILKGDGPDPINNDGTFSKEPKTPSKDNIIEYRTTYTNISEAQSGTGNVTLDADKVVIEEDGVGGNTNGGSAADNNWALDSDGDNIIDTSNVVGTAADSNGSNILFFSGNPATTTAGDQTGTDANTDVTRYVNEVTNPVEPGTNGEFTFQRKVN